MGGLGTRAGMWNVGGLRTLRIPWIQGPGATEGVRVGKESQALTSEADQGSLGKERSVRKKSERLGLRHNHTAGGGRTWARGFGRAHGTLVWTCRIRPLAGRQGGWC